MSLASEIVRLRSRSLADLDAAAGDLSMCAIAKSGIPMPALKYHEGRVAMLRDLERAMVEGTIDRGALAAISARWGSKRALAEHSRDWEAYLSGGDDVIADLGL